MKTVRFPVGLLFSLVLFQVVGCGLRDPSKLALSQVPPTRFTRVRHTFVVNSTVDAHDAKPGDGICASAAGACTLRAAVEEANTLPGHDVIEVPSSTSTFVLSLGTLNIRDSLFLNGSGNTIIDGNNQHRVLEVNFNQWLICDSANHSVLRYSSNGQFVGGFVTPGSGNLQVPLAATIGSGVLNDDLLVAGLSSGIHRYDGNTGAFKSHVVQPGTGGLLGPTDLVFDSAGGALYVADYVGGSILRYDANGAFKGTFIQAGSGGLANPNSLLLHRNSLYVSSAGTDAVLRYDSTSGNFLSAFVTPSSGGLHTPRNFTFGPDGNLYVASWGNDRILRYNGTTGAFMNEFVSAGSGALSKPFNLVFGPDGHMYVISDGTDQILRYNGTTGQFIGVFLQKGASLVSPACLLSVPGIGAGPIVNISGVTVRNGKGPSDQGFGGGGLFISRGSTVVLTNSTITQNFSGQFGGGISNAGFLRVSRSTISNNRLYPFELSTSPDTTCSGQGGGQTASGGGIFNFSSGTIEIDSSTINGNKATRGGGIRNSLNGILWITNSTISGNSACTRGGGIMNQGTSTISFTTISQNKANLADRPEAPAPPPLNEEDTYGGGIWNGDGGVVSLGDTILARNTDDRSRFLKHPDGWHISTPDCYSRTNLKFTSQGHNLVGILNDGCLMMLKTEFDPVTGLVKILDQVGHADSTTNNQLDPLLDPLLNNGGPSPTHAPRAGSPVIDLGGFVTGPDFFDCPATDQRGSPRLVDGDGDGILRCDVGAVER